MKAAAQRSLWARRCRRSVLWRCSRDEGKDLLSQCPDCLFAFGRDDKLTDTESLDPAAKLLDARFGRADQKHRAMPNLFGGKAQRASNAVDRVRGGGFGIGYHAAPNQIADRDRRARAAVAFALVTEILDALAEASLVELRQIGGVEPARASQLPGNVGDISVASRHSQDRPPAAADYDWRIWLLDRFGPQHGVAQLVMPAVEVGDLFGPQRTDTGQRLIQHLSARFHVRKRDSAHREFHFGPAGAQTRDQPAAADVIERGQSLCGNKRMAEQVVQHQVADAQRARGGEQRGGAGQRIQVGLVCGMLARLRQLDVVAEVKRGVAGRLSGLRKRDQFGKLKSGGVYSKIHGWFPVFLMKWT